MDDALYVTHDQLLRNGDWVADRVIYSAKEVKVMPLLVAVSAISLVAVFGLLVVLMVAAWENRKSEAKSYFFRTNVAVYFVWMLLSDVMQAVGAIMTAKWIILGGVQTGEFCTAQGVIKHIAHISTGAWSLVIAMHTFTVLFCQVQPPRYVMWAAVFTVHSILGILCFIGPLIYQTGKTGNGAFYGISGYWCWISDEYTGSQAGMDYGIMFVTAFFSFVLYVLVFLRMRGNIIVIGRFVSWRWKKDDDWAGLSVDDRALNVAKQMLLYPVAYTVSILPIACVRFTTWTGHNVPFGVTIFSDTIFLLSGIVNVILFSVTRRTSHALPSRKTLSHIISPKRFNKTDSSGSTTLMPEETIATFGNVDASLLPDPKRMSTYSIGPPVSFRPISYRKSVTPPTPLTQNQSPPSPSPVPSPEFLSPPVATPVPRPAVVRRPSGARQPKGYIEKQRKQPPPLSITSLPEQPEVISEPSTGKHPAGPRPMRKTTSPPSSTRPISQFFARLSPSRMLSGFLQYSPTEEDIPDVPGLPTHPPHSAFSNNKENGLEKQSGWGEGGPPA